VIRAFFINFSVSLLSMVLRSLCYFGVFIPLIIHSAVVLQCDFWLSCPSLSVYPPLSSLLFLVIVNFPPPPSSYLTGVSDTLSLSIIHNNFFLDLVTAMPFIRLYFFSVSSFFCILLLLSTQQLSYYCPPTFAMYYDNKQKPPPTFFPLMVYFNHRALSVSCIL